MGIRGFAVCRGFEKEDVALPFQTTERSAGYDFKALFGALIPPGKAHLVPTGVKAYMQEDEVLLLHIRSSVAYIFGLCLANGTGVIDASYFENPDNDGHIMFLVRNLSSTSVEIKAGDRIGQGIFQKYLQADSGNSTDARVGGIGSTGV